MRLRRQAAVPGAALVLGLVIGGCSAGESAGDSGPEEESTASGGWVLPLDAYQRTDEEYEVLDRAQEILIADCMAPFGFDYRAPEQPKPPEVPGAHRHSYLFGVSDRDLAEQYGYARPGVVTGEEPPEPSLSETGLLVLYGPEELREDEPEEVVVAGQVVPNGGCGGESARTLYTPDEDSVDSFFLYGLGVEAGERAKADREAVAVTEAWSTCMADVGYLVSDPMGVTAEFGFADEELSSPKAVRAAVTDVDCKPQ